MSDRWPALLKREEAAEYLGVGVTTLNGLRASEQIKSVRVLDGVIRYRRSDLDEFIERLEEDKGQFKGKRNGQRD
jgi:excisionase family DNA binding protein